jgi:glycosyltransferase involved in cell wall biosynthesis
MNVALLTQYYSPESGAPQRRLSDLAARLTSLGHGVEVVTALPNYPEGRIHRGYAGRAWTRETLDGVQVLRSWLYTNESRSFAHRVANYLSFAGLGLVRGAIGLGGTDVVIVESPPIFLGPSGWILSLFRGARFVLNVSDLFTESAVQLGALRSKRLVRLSRAIEQFCYDHAALVLGQTQGIVDDISRRAPQTRVELYPNGVDIELFHPRRRDERLRAERGWTNQFVVGFAGLHGPSQGLDGVIDAARWLRDRRDIRFAFVGAGPRRDELEATTRRERLYNCVFLERQPPDSMPALLASFDAALVPLANLPVLLGARPSKMFEAMGSARPILLAARGEAEALVDRFECGLTSDPEDGAALAQNVLRLADNRSLAQRLGENGRRAAISEFSRDAIARRVASMLEDAVRGDRR